MKILKLKDVQDRCGLSKSSIYAFVKQGKFPKPLKLSERAVGWEEDSINTWIQERRNMAGAPK